MSVGLKRGRVCIAKNVTEMIDESLGGCSSDHIERFEYKKATMENVDELVRTRIIALRAASVTKKLDHNSNRFIHSENCCGFFRKIELQ